MTSTSAEPGSKSTRVRVSSDRAALERWETEGGRPLNTEPPTSTRVQTADTAERSRERTV